MGIGEGSLRPNAVLKQMDDKMEGITGKTALSGVKYIELTWCYLFMNLIVSCKTSNSLIAGTYLINCAMSIVLKP